jgi:hypothetical protein
MYNPETDLLFPPRSLPALSNLRGRVWQDLVANVLEAGNDSIEQMAFVLMMARLNNCTTCNADSFRGMTGCATCTTLSLKRFHETDDALATLFQATREEVEQYLQKKNHPISR